MREFFLLSCWEGNDTDCTRPVSREGGDGLQKWAAKLLERSSLIALADTTGLDGWPTG